MEITCLHQRGQDRSGAGQDNIVQPVLTDSANRLPFLLALVGTLAASRRSGWSTYSLDR